MCSFVSFARALNPLFLFFFLPNLVRDVKNQSEDYKINKPLYGLMVYRMIIPLAERLSSKVQISENLSAAGIILRYTSCRKGFIY